MRRLASLPLVLLLAGPISPATAQQWTRTADGRIQVTPVAVDPQFRNRDWPASWEREFRERADCVVRQTARPGSYGNTWDTSVYLLAEEARHEETRQLYKQRLRDYVVTLYYTGMGEWDSENYLGHSLAPLLNLYDFAHDPDVKRLAKAGLDWMTAAAAVKYWRGAYNGPTRRDYHHPYPFGGSAAALTWMWFGDSPLPPQEFESDEIHVITSAYRPQPSWRWHANSSRARQN